MGQALCQAPRDTGKDRYNSSKCKSPGDWRKTI